MATSTKGGEASDLHAFTGARPITMYRIWGETLWTCTQMRDRQVMMSQDPLLNERTCLRADVLAVFGPGAGQSAFVNGHSRTVTRLRGTVSARVSYSRIDLTKLQS